jgi:hypothetical protein
MAIISPDTFRPLKRHIACRLQQGVPIVDADWNEMEDIRRFELRAFLKWFVGDGIPEGTDGFRVVGEGQPNDFLVRAGPAPAVLSTDPVEHGLRDVGRLLVDGRDILIDSDFRFRQQPLHISQPGSAALAAALGVPVVPELPSVDGEVLVYVDVWDRLLTPAEEPSLVVPGLGTESCARLKREWVVRARPGINVPRLTSPPDPDYLPGHSYCELARIFRRPSNPSVLASDVTDSRARRLLVPPATLVEDVLGVNQHVYRRGVGRPALSIREALNALLHGEIPSTPDRPITLDMGVDTFTRAVAFDRQNGIVAAWYSSRVDWKPQIFVSRLSLDNMAAGFDPAPIQVTSGSVVHVSPRIAVLPNGELLVAYWAEQGGGDVLYKRGTYATLASATAQPVAATASQEFPTSVEVSGNFVVFIFSDGNTKQLHFRRLRHTDNTWLDPAPVLLSSTKTWSSDFHSTVAADGKIWAAFVRYDTSATPPIDELHLLTLDPATGTVTNQATLATGTSDRSPFIISTASGQVWAFWHGPGGLMMTRFVSGAWRPAQAVAVSAEGDQAPSVVEDPQGGLWLFFERAPTGRLFYARYDLLTDTWSAARPVPSSAPASSARWPFALTGPDRSTWLFWESLRDGSQNLYFKQLFTTI